MDESELNKTILTRLGRGANRDDLLLEVCREANLSWPEAEALVSQVEAGHSVEIARRQSPFIIILSLGGLLAGLAWGAWAGAGIYAILRAMLAASDQAFGEILGVAYIFRAVQYYIPSLLGALGLCIGGAVGLTSGLSAWKPGK
jgi:hypothetical protein